MLLATYAVYALAAAVEAVTLFICFDTLILFENKSRGTCHAASAPTLFREKIRKDISNNLRQLSRRFSNRPSSLMLSHMYLYKAVEALRPRLRLLFQSPL